MVIKEAQRPREFGKTYSAFSDANVKRGKKSREVFNLVYLVEALFACSSRSFFSDIIVLSFVFGTDF